MTLKSISKATLLLALVGTLTTGCSSLNLGTAANLLAALASNPDLSTFSSLLSGVGGLDKLLPGGEGSLFVPTNSAFKDLGQSMVDKLSDPSNTELALDALKGHSSSSVLTPEQLSSSGSFMNQTGNSVNVSGEGKALKIGDADVQQAIKTDNGYLYIINKVLGT